MSRAWRSRSTGTSGTPMNPRLRNPRPPPTSPIRLPSIPRSDSAGRGPLGIPPRSPAAAVLGQRHIHEHRLVGAEQSERLARGLLRGESGPPQLLDRKGQLAVLGFQRLDPRLQLA